MMALPARRARWAGCGGSSAPRARHATGRSGVHRRLSCFACRPIRRPPPPSRARPQLAPPLRSPRPQRRGAPSSVRRALARSSDIRARRNGRPSNRRRRRSTASCFKSLDDDQALEVVSIPLAGKSNIADHMVIASGRSTRQVASMATKLAERIKEEVGRSSRIEGLAGRRLGADRRRRRHRPPVPARSAQLLQSRADVGVRRRRQPQARGRGAAGA